MQGSGSGTIGRERRRRRSDAELRADRGALQRQWSVRDLPVVLLIQPEHDDRDMYHAYFEHAGLIAVCRSTGVDAVRLAEFCDVVVTALNLPGPVSGVDVIASLRANSRTARMPIVVLTSSAWVSDRHRAEKAGCDAFLAKPCVPSMLVREIRRVLREVRLRQLAPTPAYVKPLARRRRKHGT